MQLLFAIHYLFSEKDSGLYEEEGGRYGCLGLHFLSPECGKFSLEFPESC